MGRRHRLQAVPLRVWCPRDVLFLPCLVVFLLSPVPLAARQEATIRGVVVDSVAESPMAGVEVLVRGTPLRVLTDKDGRFEISVGKQGTYALFVAALGYRAVEREVETGASVPAWVTISLERTPLAVPGVTVTASRGWVRPGDESSSVAVLSGDEVVRRDVTSLKDALLFAQGVTFNAGQMDIRGSTGIARGVGSRVLMLLDGHRVLAGVGSAIDFGLLPLLDVERIEIVKGPHSTLWGTNAMAGVVNVITRPPVGGPRTTVRGYYGLFDTPGKLDFTDEHLNMQGIQLQHTRRIGSANSTLFVGREGSDGFRQNGGLERWQLRSKVVFGAETVNPWEVFFNLKREDAEEFFTWLSPERPLEVQPEQLGDWKRDTDIVLGMAASPLVTSVFKLQFRPQIQHVRSQNHFHDNRDFYRSTRYGTDLQASFFASGRHTVTTGADASFTTFASDFLEPDPEVRDFAVFAQDEIQLSDRMRGTAGVRIDLHRASSVEGDLSVNPKIGLVFHPFDRRLSLRTSISRGYRAPSVAEQYTRAMVFGFRVVPNLGLRGESAWAGEISATAVPSERVWFDAGLFWSEYSGLIEVGAAPDQILTFQFQNVARARVRGIDAGVQIGVVPEKLSFRTNYLFLDSEDKLTGKTLPYRSRHNITTSFSGLSDRLGLDLRYRSRAERVLAFPLDERGHIALVDLRFAMRVMDVDVQTKITNLLQAEYVDVQERNPGATRSFRITLTSRF